MLLNPFERRLVSGSLRRSVMRHWDLPRLQRIASQDAPSRLLEIGCGHGYGVEAAYQLLQAQVVHAFDPDSEMVAKTRQSMTRNGDFQRTPSAKVWQGHTDAIPAADAEYDTVLCLQVLHHVENWRSAVKELARVLKPGGQLLIAESLIQFLEHPLFGRWMDHPTSDRFDLVNLRKELEQSGFRIVGTKGRGKWMIWLVAERVA